jgi:arsenate reductase (thioredoxin)
MLIYFMPNSNYMVTSMESQEKKTILFLCIHNSARSQMAEGLLRAIYGDRYEAYSAGVEITTVNPYAIAVMKEIGIDISSQHSKTPQEFQDIIFDMAATVCDRANVVCPICSTNLELPTQFPRAREVIHETFEDPAAAVGSEEEKLKVFRRVRDEIKDWISQTFGK